MAKSYKVITGLVRFSYVNVFAPLVNHSDKPFKYSVAIIIPKHDDETISAINLAVHDCKVENRRFLDNLPLDEIRGGLRDGDLEKNDPAYDDSYFVNATSTTQPGVVDAMMQPIVKPSQFYSGCFGRASLTFYAYNNGPHARGIGCTINNLQKLKDGPKLGTYTSPEEDFQSIQENPDNKSG